jgi:hypothetical protein
MPPVITNTILRGGCPVGSTDSADFGKLDTLVVQALINKIDNKVGLSTTKIADFTIRFFVKIITSFLPTSRPGLQQQG